ncbi:hypothetical protein C0Z22_04700 [Halobacteriovorax sp. DA5]|nr:hypothetical protein C0Z22_04700 [Halobacteriovorax sp. DA5]
MEQNIESFKQKLNLIQLEFKNDISISYNSNIKKIQEQLKFLYSGSLGIFLLNTENLITLCGKGALLWSIIFFTAAFILQWFFNLPSRAINTIINPIEKATKSFFKLIEEYEKKGCSTESLTNSCIENLKDTRIGTDLLETIAKEKNIENEEFSSAINNFANQILYSNKSPYKIIESEILPLNSAIEKSEDNIIVASLKRMWKDFKPILITFSLYLLGISIFSFATIHQNWNILFSFLFI